MEQAAATLGMTPTQLVRAFSVWGATHLNETRRVIPEVTTERQRQIKTLTLQILVDPTDLSMRKSSQREIWIATETIDPILARLKQAIVTLVEKGEDTDDLVPGAKQWYRHHAIHIKSVQYDALKIPVPHDFADVVPGAVRLCLFADGDVDIPLGPRQQKELLPGARVDSLLFARGNGKKRRMLISQDAPKPSGHSRAQGSPKTLPLPRD